jgi:hypothetical protein
MGRNFCYHARVMKLLSRRKATLILPVLLGLIGIGQPWLRAEAALTANEVVQKAVARAGQAEAQSGQRSYTYTKCSVTEELDSEGKVKERKEKTYRVFFQGGSTHLKLMEVNGHAPEQADVNKQAENDLNARQLLGAPNSSKRANRDNFLTPELVSRFDFNVIGQSEMNSRQAYQISFQPKNPEPPVRRVVDRLLNRLSGTLWIDAQEFEVARADVHLRSEVSLLGGLVGSLKKLAFTMTRTRVADGIWLNTFSSGDFEGRKLIDWMRIKTKSQSTNFRMLGLAS